MSKGLGTLQRKLIEISTATQTIWQAIPNGVKFGIADVTEKTACGVTTTREGESTWRKTGEPYYFAETRLHSFDEYIEAKRTFKSLYVIDKYTDSALPACWSMHHIRATLWPELWDQSDMRENLPNARYEYATFPQIPQDIKTGRNVAQAGLSRAVSSLESRGILIYAGYTHSDAANALWLSHSPGGFREKPTSHIVHFVLSPIAIHQ